MVTTKCTEIVSLRSPLLQGRFLPSSAPRPATLNSSLRSSFACGLGAAVSPNRSRSASPPKKTKPRAGGVNYKKPRTPQAKKMDPRKTIATRWAVRPGLYPNQNEAKQQSKQRRMVSPIKSSSRLLSSTDSRRGPRNSEMPGGKSMIRASTSPSPSRGSDRGGKLKMRASLSPDRAGNEGRTNMVEEHMSGPVEGPAGDGLGGSGGISDAIFAYKKMLRLGSGRNMDVTSPCISSPRNAPAQRNGRWKPNHSNSPQKNGRNKKKERGRERQRAGENTGSQRKDARPQRPPMTLHWH